MSTRMDDYCIIKQLGGVTICFKKYTLMSAKQRKIGIGLTNTIH